MPHTNSNFSFLQDKWDFLLEDAQHVEAYALTDPRSAIFYARRTIDLALRWLYEKDSALKTPFEKRSCAFKSDIFLFSK